MRKKILKVFILVNFIIICFSLIGCKSNIFEGIFPNNGTSNVLSTINRSETSNEVSTSLPNFTSDNVKSTTTTPVLSTTTPIQGTTVLPTVPSTTTPLVPSTTTTPIQSTYVPNYYNVLFMVDNTVYYQENFLEADYINMPKDPTKEGYTFIGWYLDENYNMVYENTPILNDLTLYAKFDKNKDNDDIYEITFGYQGNYSNYLNIDFIDFSNVTINSNNKDNSQIKNGYITINLKKGSKLTINSYLDYTSYTVSHETFLSDIITTTLYEYEALNDLSLTITPTSTDNFFYSIIVDNSNVIEDSNSGNNNDNNDDNKEEENIELIITFIVNDEVFLTNKINYNSIIEQPSNPVISNYEFLGWYESLSDEDAFDFSSNIISNLTLYAKFNKLVTNKIESEGYEEGFYAYFEDSKSSNVTSYYKLSSSETWNVIDSELIRQVTSNITRVDMVGLSKGKYDVKVITSKNGTLLYENINVTSYDRSGYAHFNTSGVGAYNDDGTLKDNAKVIYVTEENKNTVTCKISNKTYTGIASILQNQSKSSNPLCIRIIGQVSADMWSSIDYSKSSITPSDVKGINGKTLALQNYTDAEIISKGFNTLEGKYEQISGITNKIKYDSSKEEFDSYYNMLDVSSAKNLTVEGIGSDALIYQWGFTWKNCSYVEIRNLTFDDAPEDACSFEGSDDSTTLSGFKTGHIWIHNNTFNEGNNNWDVCNEQDKHEGDGATDFKKNAYITVSYNHYYKNHKTGLVGGSDTQHTACITYHHNYYESNSSRLPLARQANMHMYNNYYYSSTGTNMSLRAGAYAFIEGCYFEKTSNPIEVKDSKSAAKVYNSEFVNCKGTNNGTKVSSRTEEVSNENIYNQKFDTDSSVFYYNSSTKTSDVLYLTSALQAKEDCIKYAGNLKEVDYIFNSSSSDNDNSNDNNNSSDNDNSNDNDNESNNGGNTNNVSKTYTFNDLSVDDYNSNITTSNYTINATSNKSVSIAKCDYSYGDIVFNKVLKTGGSGSTSYRSVELSVEKSCSITIYYCSASSSSDRGCKILDSEGNELGKSELVGSNNVYTYTYSISSSGTYYITSQNSGLWIFGYTLTY